MVSFATTCMIESVDEGLALTRHTYRQTPPAGWKVWRLPRPWASGVPLPPSNG